MIRETLQQKIAQLTKYREAAIFHNMQLQTRLLKNEANIRAYDRGVVII